MTAKITAGNVDDPLVSILKCADVFSTGKADLRREHFEHNVTLGDRIANGPHGKFFNPAINPRVDVACQMLVIPNKANRLDGLRDVRHLRNGSAHADGVDFGCGQ